MGSKTVGGASFWTKTSEFQKVGWRRSLGDLEAGSHSEGWDAIFLLIMSVAIIMGRLWGHFVVWIPDSEAHTPLAGGEGWIMQRMGMVAYAPCRSCGPKTNSYRG